MAATEEMESAMKAHYEAMRSEGTLIEQLKAHALSKGIHGIRTISRVFKQMDENGDKRLQLHEFCEGMLASGELDMDNDTLKTLFGEIDVSKSGDISFNEFLNALRPPISDSRLAMIEKAFAKFDVSGDDQINLDDVSLLYSAEFHPKFQSGEWTEEEVFENWLSQFNTHGGGYITKVDFLNYYIGVSSSIDDDEYFDVMMKQAWKMT